MLSDDEDDEEILLDGEIRGLRRKIREKDEVYERVLAAVNVGHLRHNRKRSNPQKVDNGDRKVTSPFVPVSPSGERGRRRGESPGSCKSPGESRRSSKADKSPTRYRCSNRFVN